MRNSTRVILYCNFDFAHCSYLIAGLQALRDIIVIPKLSLDKTQVITGNYFTVRLEVINDNSVTKMVFDFHDSDTFLNTQAFEWADVYFKVNFTDRTVSTATSSSLRADRLRKFYPYWAIRTKLLSKAFFFCCINLGIQDYYVRKNKGEGTNPLKSFRYVLQRFRRLWNRLSLAVYKNSEPKSSLLFYSPGCWNEISNTNPEYTRINCKRAGIIRALKKSLGNNFRGGFPRNETSEKLYSDCIWEGGSTHETYISQLKQSKFAFYSNGLYDCLSWRLGEYLISNTIPIGEEVTRKLEVDINALIIKGDIINFSENDLEKIFSEKKEMLAAYAEAISPEIALKKILNENCN